VAKVVGIRTRIPHFLHTLDLVGVPQVCAGVDGFHLGDVASDVAVELGAVDADKYAVWESGPSWQARGAVSALIVSFHFPQTLQMHVARGIVLPRLCFLIF
jgi:hypothetical protein